MNLRNAAERVWVLNVDLWSLDYVAALEKFPETGSCLDLSSLVLLLYFVLLNSVFLRYSVEHNSELSY